MCEEHTHASENGAHSNTLNAQVYKLQTNTGFWNVRSAQLKLLKVNNFIDYILKQRTLRDFELENNTNRKKMNQTLKI